MHTTLNKEQAQSQINSFNKEFDTNMVLPRKGYCSIMALPKFKSQILGYSIIKITNLGNNTFKLVKE